MDGTVNVDLVLTSIDRTCSLEVSTLRDPECSSSEDVVSLPLVVGVAVGGAVLLLLVVALAVGVAVCVVRRGRRAKCVIGTGLGGTR